MLTAARILLRPGSPCCWCDSSSRFWRGPGNRARFLPWSAFSDLTVPSKDRGPTQQDLAQITCIFTINVNKDKYRPSRVIERGEGAGTLGWRSAVCFVASGASLTTREAGVSCLLLEQEMVLEKKNAWK